MAPLGVDDGLAVGVDAKVLTGRLEMIAAASLGETVVVLVNEVAAPELYEPESFEPELFELELFDEEPLLLLPLLPLLRTREEILSTSISMKVISGPATIALLCRSMTPPFKG